MLGAHGKIETAVEKNNGQIVTETNYDIHKKPNFAVAI